MKYLNIHDVAEKLGGRSTNSIYTDVNEGRLPKPLKMGNRNLWAEPVLDEFLIDLAREQGATVPKSAQ